MKFTKLSLIAALAVSGAFAGEATVSGDVKVFYTTTDAGVTQGALGTAGKYDLLDKKGSTGDASVNLDYSRGIADGVTLNAGITGISTLGLENTAVSDVWLAGENGTDDTFWFDVANLTAKVGNTIAVIGRQKLDTPLAFTETWNVAENTFDAFTFVNSDLQDTTLVASAVTRANFGSLANPFTNFHGGMVDLGDGIYAAGAVTKLIPNTTAQLWYYDFSGTNQKVWAQADVDGGNGLTAGLQYGQSTPSVGEDASIVAGKVGYDANGMSLYAAYSQADKNGVAGSNFANYGGFGQSKLYTEAWWNYGFVGQADAQTVAVGAGYDLGAAKLTAQYTTVTNDSDAALEMDEATLTATTKVGPVDATLALINTSADHNDDIDGNTVQAYLTVPFSL